MTWSMIRLLDCERRVTGVCKPTTRLASVLGQSPMLTRLRGRSRVSRHGDDRRG